MKEKLYSSRPLASFSLVFIRRPSHAARTREPNPTVGRKRPAPANVRRTMMKTTLIAAVATALLFAATAAAAPKPNPGWTVAKAQTMVKTRASIAYCKLKPTPGSCVDGKPAPGTNLHAPATPPLYSVTCQPDSSSATKSGLYSRFACHYESVNEVFTADLSIFVTGPATFRWRAD